MEGDTLAQSPSLPRRTRASNADKHPGQILFESGLLQRRRTKAQKAEDDQCLKEAKASKEKAVREGLDRLESMKVDAKAKMAEGQSKKLDPPPRPRPRPRLVQNSRRGGGKQKDGVKGDGVEEEKDRATQEVSTCPTPTMRQPHLKLIEGGSFGYRTQLLSPRCKDSKVCAANQTESGEDARCKYLFGIVIMPQPYLFG